MAKGFSVVARRYKTKLGEIDLIARRGNLVLIVEVKRAPRWPPPWTQSAANPSGASKARRPRLSRQPDYAKLSVRFDMVAVLPWRWPVHVPNVFQGRN
jgi:putative endonuclease